VAKHTPPLPLLNLIFVISVILCSAGCVVSLAPAYRIAKESNKIEFLSGQTPGLKLTASYTLENYGTIVLPSIDVALPDASRYGIKDLLIKVDGHAVTAPPASGGPQEEQAAKVRIPFDPGWNPKQRRDVVIEYTLSAPQGSETRVGVAAASFYLISPGWLPVLQAPNHALASLPADAGRSAYAVQIPADFLVLSPGKPRGRKKNQGMVEYRFELRKDELDPYIVAGRYVTTSSKQREGGAIFWTFGPLKEDPAAAEERMASVANILQRNFGPLGKSYLVVHVVESPRPHAAGSDEPMAAPFPAGVLANPQAIALGINSPSFSKLVASGLAHSWFPNMNPLPDSLIGIDEGLPEYADIVVDQALEGRSMRSQIALKYLKEYSEGCKEAVEKPLISTTLQDPVEQRRIALAKAPLFFIALEDAYGEEPVRRALTQIRSLLRGQGVTYPELRAALENVTNKDLEPMFRTWVYNVGIPVEFQEKYENADAGKN
jgi:hypothetical protein